MKAIFPSAVDGDLLKLVHLSNGFRLLEGATPLKAGDVCKAEARIVGVTNSDAGKTVKVKGYVTRGGEKVIEVVSSFLYRSSIAFTGSSPFSPSPLTRPSTAILTRSQRLSRSIA